MNSKAPTSTTPTPAPSSPNPAPQHQPELLFLFPQNVITTTSDGSQRRDFKRFMEIMHGADSRRWKKASRRKSK